MSDPTPNVLKPAHRMASRLIDGRALIIDPRSDRLDRLNDTASFIWSMVTESCHTEAAIAEALVAHFDVDLASAKDDVRLFVADLAAKGYLATP